MKNQIKILDVEKAEISGSVMLKLENGDIQEINELNLHHARISNENRHEYHCVFRTTDSEGFNHYDVFMNYEDFANGA